MTAARSRTDQARRPLPSPEPPMSHAAPHPRQDRPIGPPRRAGWRALRVAALVLLAMSAPAQAAAALNGILEDEAYQHDSWGLTRTRDTRGCDSQGCVHMAQISTSTADQIGVSHDIIVSSADELQAALATASDGATIRLMAGNYGALELTGFARDLTLVADRDAPAVLSRMDLREVQGLTFDGLVFDFEPVPGALHQVKPFKISQSQDITIRNALFDGGDALDTGTVADGYGTGIGLSIGSSQGITLENSEIRGFWKGLTMGNNDDVVLKGNAFHDMRSDGITMGSMWNTRIENNHFHDFQGAPGSGDHTDMIQLLGSSGGRPSEALTVRGNIFNIGEGTGAQALFLSNKAAQYDDGTDLFHRDFVIEDNLILNKYKNGLFVSQVDGLVLRNNTVLHFDPVGGPNGDSAVPIIAVHPDSRNVVIADNVAAAVSGHADQADWTVSGNVTVQNRSPIEPNHYSVHFLDPTGSFALDLAKLTVRPDSVIAEQGAGASMLIPSGTSDSLTPRILAEASPDNRATYVFDAGMTTGSDGPVDDSMADFVWTFSDGTSARGMRVEHTFPAPGTYTGTLTVTLPDGHQSVTQTEATVRDSTVLSFDGEAGTLVKHGLDGLQVLADAPLVDHPGVEGRFLDLGALDTAITLPSALLNPVHDVGRMEIDMRLAALPGHTGSGEILRQHDAFVVSVQNGEVKFALHQEDGTWAGAITSGARMDSGMWRDVKLVHDTAAARLEIWIDDTLNAATDGVGAMKGSSRDVTLGGAFSRTAFDAALEQLEIRSDPDAYTFDMPEMEQLPGGTMPAPEDESRLDRPDLDTLRAEIEAGTSDLTLREAAPDSPDIWADRGGSLLVGDDGWDRLRDRGGDDVMHGGAGPDQFVFDMRHTDHAQTNRILDLDFNDGDVVRFMTGNSAERIWMKSVDDIQAAVDSGVLTATLDADDSALQLSLARLPQHVVEIDLHAGFAWPDMA